MPDQDPNLEDRFDAEKDTVDGCAADLVSDPTADAELPPASGRVEVPTDG